MTRLEPMTATHDSAQGAAVRVTRLRPPAEEVAWETFRSLVWRYAEGQRARGSPLPPAAEEVLRSASAPDCEAYLATRPGAGALGFMVLTKAVTVGSGAPTLWIQDFYCPNAPDALRLLLATAERRARAHGISMLTFDSPYPGMGRLSRRYGFRRLSITYGKEV